MQHLINLFDDMNDKWFEQEYTSAVQAIEGQGYKPRPAFSDPEERAKLLREKEDAERRLKDSKRADEEKRRQDMNEKTMSGMIIISFCLIPDPIYRTVQNNPESFSPD